MAAARSRLPYFLGITALGGAGYYFYSAGGSAKGAENRAEADLHKASANIRKGTDAQGAGARAGAKFDSAVGLPADSPNI